MRWFLVLFLVMSSAAQADVFDRINQCEAQGGGACVFNLLRELVRANPPQPLPPGAICSTSTATEVFYQIAGGSASSAFSCAYSGPHSGTFPSVTFDPLSGRWSCSSWARGNSGYTVTLVLDGVSHSTDENSALARPCPGS